MKMVMYYYDMFHIDSYFYDIFVRFILFLALYFIMLNIISYILYSWICNWM